MILKNQNTNWIQNLDVCFRLIDEITKLEVRQKDLIGRLARVDPEMCAQKLQAQLQVLQDRNRTLKSVAKNAFIEDDEDDEKEVQLGAEESKFDQQNALPDSTKDA